MQALHWARRLTVLHRLRDLAATFEDSTLGALYTGSDRQFCRVTYTSCIKEGWSNSHGSPKMIKQALVISKILMTKRTGGVALLHVGGEPRNVITDCLAKAALEMCISSVPGKLLCSVGGLPKRETLPVLKAAAPERHQWTMKAYCV